MISFVDARELIIQEAVLQGTEPLPLASALNRVLAEDIYADRDYPPFNRAAMDGYALRFQDYNNGIRSFKIVKPFLQELRHSCPLFMANVTRS